MRALHFAKPIEYRVEIPAEQFVQGETVTGTLTVVNRDAAAQSGLAVRLGLAQAQFKQLKAVGAEALEILETQTLAEGLELGPGAQERFEWRFELPLGFPVTTSESGPFLLYGGTLEDPAARGQIDLPVALAPALEAFIVTLENHFAFEARTRKSAGQFTEVKFKPPASYSTLEELVVAMRMDGGGAELQFRGRMKGLRRGESGGVKNRKVEESRSVPQAELLTPSGQPNRPAYRKLLDSVLEAFLPPLQQKSTS